MEVIMKKNRNEDEVDDNKSKVIPGLVDCFFDKGTRLTDHTVKVVEYHRNRFPRAHLQSTVKVPAKEGSGNKGSSNKGNE